MDIKFSCLVRSIKVTSLWYILWEKLNRNYAVVLVLYILSIMFPSSIRSIPGLFRCMQSQYAGISRLDSTGGFNGFGNGGSLPMLANRYYSTSNGDSSSGSGGSNRKDCASNCNPTHGTIGVTAALLGLLGLGYILCYDNDYKPKWRDPKYINQCREGLNNIAKEGYTNISYTQMKHVVDNHKKRVDIGYQPILQFVDDSLKTEQMCIDVIKNDSYEIHYVPEQLYSNNLFTAYIENGGCISDVPPEFQTAKICEYWTKNCLIKECSQCIDGGGCCYPLYDRINTIAKPHTNALLIAINRYPKVVKKIKPELMTESRPYPVWSARRRGWRTRRLGAI